VTATPCYQLHVIFRCARGLPFTQPETENEWEDQVNWDELERETSVD